MLSNENMLQPFQIIFASVANRRLTKDEVSDLLHIARKNNESVDVGGMLIHHDGCFLQVLEGPRIAVEAIYTRVKTDPRHRNVKLLLRYGISEVEFGESAMAYLDAGTCDKGLKGYANFLMHFCPNVKGESQAMRVLSRFKQGDWHDHVLDNMSKSA